MKGTLYYNGERVCELESVTIDKVDNDDARERFHIWYLLQLANGKPEDFFKFEYWRTQ